jgi:hypothetical protein
MVKNGFYSSFVFSSLIWACFLGKSWPRAKMTNHGFQQILKEVEFFHNTLRLHLARLELQGTQEDQKQMHTSNLPPNPKTRLTTILHQFRDKAARANSEIEM